MELPRSDQVLFRPLMVDVADFIPVTAITAISRRAVPQHPVVVTYLKSNLREGDAAVEMHTAEPQPCMKHHIFRARCL
jgi:hypothetical protein